MDDLGKNKIETGRNIQSSLFIQSLRKEMDKLHSLYSPLKDEMAKKASGYLADGFSEKEVEELLIVDGYDKDLIHSYITQAASEENSVFQWGFDFMDENGKLLSDEDMENEIFAADENEAFKQSSDSLKAAGFDVGAGCITAIYKIN